MVLLSTTNKELVKSDLLIILMKDDSRYGEFSAFPYRLLNISHLQMC